MSKPSSKRQPTVRQVIAACEKELRRLADENTQQEHRMAAGGEYGGAMSFRAAARASSAAADMLSNWVALGILPRLGNEASFQRAATMNIMKNIVAAETKRAMGSKP